MAENSMEKTKTSTKQRSEPKSPDWWKKYENPTTCRTIMWLGGSFHILDCGHMVRTGPTCPSPRDPCAPNCLNMKGQSDLGSSIICRECNPSWPPTRVRLRGRRSISHWKYGFHGLEELDKKQEKKERAADLKVYEAYEPPAGYEKVVGIVLPNDFFDPAKGYAYPTDVTPSVPWSELRREYGRTRDHEMEDAEEADAEGVDEDEDSRSTDSEDEDEEDDDEDEGDKTTHNQEEATREDAVAPSGKMMLPLRLKQDREQMESEHAASVKKMKFCISG